MCSIFVSRWDRQAGCVWTEEHKIRFRWNTIKKWKCQEPQVTCEKVKMGNGGINWQQNVCVILCVIVSTWRYTAEAIITSCGGHPSFASQKFNPTFQHHLCELQSKAFPYHISPNTKVNSHSLLFVKCSYFNIDIKYCQILKYHQNVSCSILCITLITTTAVAHM